ncbi:MAG: biopolymer transporter ExbD [Pseudomonadota bacterium]
MALRRERRRRRASITSLIDVIFLLLLFFMLSSTFSQFSELEIASVTNREAPAANAPVDLVTLEILQDGIRVNGGAVQDAELASRLSLLLTRDGRVSVDVADSVTTQRMVETLILLNGLDGISIQLVAPA